MDSQFSPRIKDIIGYSREEAIRLGNDYIGQEHLFLGILRDGEGMATDILENLGIVLNEIKEIIEKKIRTDRVIDNKADIVMLKAAEKTLKLVLDELGKMAQPIESKERLQNLAHYDERLSGEYFG